MHIERLIQMANDIGDYFAAEPDRNEAITGIHNHIRRFWDPRMRRQIIEYLQQDGSELNEMVREAVRKLEPVPNRTSA
ncbi:MAG TPA: formate dehydrogenase subunit delta [Gammaproteobacteria bacterium]|nr:formate dehydrogenase subunit delta [Gammaproteobacteria bacterium]